MTSAAPGGRGAALAATLAALAAWLPFARGTLGGASFYFRDLAGQFFPVRQYVAEGLRQGELRWWNPLSFEGVPVSPPPLGYLPDLLHALRPDPAFFSLLLALHLPLAALGFFLLGRRLGATPAGAATGAVAFALSGFALSTLNLYVFAEALPWCALAVLGLVAAAGGSRREVALAGLAGAVALSTTALELVAQAFVIGVVLARPRRLAELGRLAAALALAVAAAAYVIGPVSAMLGGSARGSGLPTEVVLAHSVHPMALLQTVIGGLFGDPSRFADRFWGANFFPRGFPYVLSLYVGLPGLALAALGAHAGPTRHTRPLLVLAALALVVCLGTWAGLTPLVDALGSLRKLRFPVKAFFTVQFAVSLLAAFGLDALRRGERLREFAAVCVAGGGLLAAGPWLLLKVPASAGWFLARFFPPGLPWPARQATAASIAADAASGAAVAVAAGLVVALAAAGRLRPRLAGAAVSALLVADLLRHGAGLNPMVDPAFLRPSPEVAALAARLRAEGGRVVPLDPGYSPAYYAARAARGAHELWSFGVVIDALSPETHLVSGVSTALTPDRTMLVPEARVLAPEQAAPGAVGGLVARMREAAVAHVVSLDALEAPGLELETTLAPARIAPLRLNVYRLARPLPIAELTCPGGAGEVLGSARSSGAIDLSVRAGVACSLEDREAFAAGWRASVDGQPTALAPAPSGHRRLAVPPGDHAVRLAYRPPGLLPGAALSAASLALLALLAAPRRRAGPR